MLNVVHTRFKDYVGQLLFFNNYWVGFFFKIFGDCTCYQYQYLSYALLSTLLV
jgi:hypothetical protein